MEKDKYEVLGLEAGCSDKDIKKAYHKLAKLHHPDAGGDEKEFQVIDKAYKILSDKKLRAMYDRGEEVDNIPSLEDKAIQNLAKLFDMITSGKTFMANHTDLVVMVRSEINERSISMHSDLEEVEHDIGKMKIVSTRLKKADFIQPSISQTISSMELRAENIEEALDTQQIMLDMLEESYYETIVDTNTEWEKVEWVK